MKTHCPHCDKDLPATAFYKNASRPNGASILCKNCFRAYEASPERRAKRTWNTLHTRVRLQESYAGVEVRMSRDEYLAWALPAFSAWMGQNSGTPSVDRIDPKGHYEVGNLRILERGENARLASNHPNVYAPPGAAWCSACRQYLPRDGFYRCADKFNGLQSRCKPCHDAALKSSSLKRLQRAA